MQWWMLALAGAALFLVWYVRRTILRGTFIHAAAYAGYTLDDLRADRIPSCQEVAAGIRRQPERFAQRAWFLASRLEPLAPQEQTLFLKECRTHFDAFLAAADEGKPVKQLQHELYLLGKRAVAASAAPKCPAELRRSLVEWGVDILSFVRVVQTILPRAKHCNCAPSR